MHEVDGCTSKSKQTIDKLDSLLTRTVAAEELHDSWHVVSTKRTTEPRLSNLYSALDAGRTISYRDEKTSTRGVPMWIVVRTCKAKWHHDGSWPLLGSDECINEASSPPPPRSVHPSRLLLRPPGTTCYLAPTDDASQTARAALRPDPSADEIAQGYRRRGIAVEEAAQTIEIDD